MWVTGVVMALLIRARILDIAVDRFVGGGMGMIVLAPMGMVVDRLGMGGRRRQGEAIGLAGPGALSLTELAALHQTLDMVMVAVLRRSHLLLKTEHLGAVLAQGAIHVSVAAQHLSHPLLEGVQHQSVITQIGGLDELHRWMIVRHQLGVLTDAADQHT